MPRTHQSPNKETPNWPNKPTSHQPKPNSSPPTPPGMPPTAPCKYWAAVAGQHFTAPEGTCRTSASAASTKAPTRFSNSRSPLMCWAGKNGKRLNESEADTKSDRSPFSCRDGIISYLPEKLVRHPLKLRMNSFHLLRRDFLQVGASSALGLGLPALLAGRESSVALESNQGKSK